MTGTGGLRRYECGCVSAEGQAHLEALRQSLDSTLLRRKGELIVPCAGSEAAPAVDALYERFYAIPTFDTAPALAAALRAVERERPSLLEEMPLALVLREMELVAVGSAQAAVRVIRQGVSREIFCPQGPGAALRATLIDPSSQGQPLYAASWRLSSGDVVVVGYAEMLQRAGDAALARAVRRARSAAGAARAIARAGRARRDQQPPLAVIYATGLTPVPEMPPRPGAKPVEKPAELKRRRQGHSSIWIALAVAAVMIGLSLWISRPDLSRENITRWLELMVLPAPTPTVAPQAAASPSPTAAYAYAAPLLASPKADDLVLTREVTLRWNWDGRLDADEAFDVRVWRAGAAERSVALTRELQQTVRLSDVGWYEWTVVVVRRQEGAPLQPLSPPAKAVQFFWRTED